MKIKWIMNDFVWICSYSIILVLGSEMHVNYANITSAKIHPIYSFIYFLINKYIPSIVIHTLQSHKYKTKIYWQGCESVSPP